MTIFFQIDVLGEGLGPTFILSDDFGLTNPFEFTRQELLDGVEIQINSESKFIYIRSTGIFCKDCCENDVQFYPLPTTTTTTAPPTTTTTSSSTTTTIPPTSTTTSTTSSTTSTSTTTSTTTSTSSTTTTTTATPVCECYSLENTTELTLTYDYTQCNGNVLADISITGGDAQNVCARVGTVVADSGITVTPSGISCISDVDCNN